MKAETQILNGYWGLLNTLTPNLKLKLIERLSNSINEESSINNDRFEKSFGAWIDSKDSDEIIAQMRESRTFNRQIESF